MTLDEIVSLQGIFVTLMIIAISLMIIISRLEPPKKSPPQTAESKA